MSDNTRDDKSEQAILLSTKAVCGRGVPGLKRVYICGTMEESDVGDINVLS